ncbi:hypothetical protein ACK3TF_000432 [Chlorella vulgaris]
MLQSSRLATWAVLLFLTALLHSDSSSAVAAAAGPPPGIEGILADASVPSLPPALTDDPPEPHHAAIAAWRAEFLEQTKRSQADPAALQPRLRANLVVVLAGDDFDSSQWMNQPELSSWDLVVIYHGQSVEAFTCPECVAVYAAAGAKWHLLYRFTLLPEWQQYKQQYAAIMLPDDDLQPSVCHGSWEFHNALFHDNEAVLHYTSFVEVMAPIFSMDFFEGVVRHTLHNAFFGWGLDYIWGSLLRDAPNRTAVLDVGCMLHAKREEAEAGRLYAVDAPLEPLQELHMHLGDYQVEASSCEVWGHVRWHEVALPGQTTEPTHAPDPITHVPDPTTPVAQGHTALPPAAAAAAAAEAEPAAKATAAAAQDESAAKATAAAAQDESAATAAPAPAPSPPLQAGGALFGSQTLACLLVVCVFLVPQLLLGRRRRLNSFKRQRAFLLA